MTFFDTRWILGLLEKSPAQLSVYALAVFALGATAGVRAGKMDRDDFESKVNEKEHEMTRLAEQAKGERMRVTQAVGLLRRGNEEGDARGDEANHRG